MNGTLRSAGRNNTSTRAKNEEIKRYYKEWWESPKDIRNVVFDRLTNLVSDRIRRRRCGKALDLGAGKGRVLALLADAGFSVTGVEFNSDFVKDLRTRFPSAKIVCADVRDWEPNEVYDVVTCIELSQVLTHPELVAILKRMRSHTSRILVSISNRWSLHGVWVRLRRFQAPFIVTYTPKELEQILDEAGYSITFKAGIGFLTPLSLLTEFRLIIVSKRLAARFEKFDKYFPGWCHLFVTEAVPASSMEG